MAIAWHAYASLEHESTGFAARRARLAACSQHAVHVHAGNQCYQLLAEPALQHDRQQGLQHADSTGAEHAQTLNLA